MMKRPILRLHAKPGKPTSDEVLRLHAKPGKPTSDEVLRLHAKPGKPTSDEVLRLHAKPGKPTSDEVLRLHATPTSDEVKRAAEQYWDRISEKILRLFRNSNGRPARTMDELTRWAKSKDGRRCLDAHSDKSGHIIPD